MRTSDQGLAFIVAHEGVVPAPYLDSVGVLTFGIGHTAAAGPPDPHQMARGMPPDLDEALAYAFATFRRDLPKYEAGVNKVLAGRTVPQHEFDAAVSFHFNTGAISHAQWVKDWLAGRKTAAAGKMMNWRKPSAVISRREAERDLFLDGTYGTKLAAVWAVGSKTNVIWKKPVRTLTQAQVVNMVRPAPPPEPRPAPVLPPVVPGPPVTTDTDATIVRPAARWAVAALAIVITLYLAFGG